MGVTDSATGNGTGRGATGGPTTARPGVAPRGLAAVVLAVTGTLAVTVITATAEGTRALLALTPALLVVVASTVTVAVLELRRLPEAGRGAGAALTATVAAPVAAFANLLVWVFSDPADPDDLSLIGSGALLGIALHTAQMGFVAWRTARDASLLR